MRIKTIRTIKTVAKAASALLLGAALLQPCSSTEIVGQEFTKRFPGAYDPFVECNQYMGFAKYYGTVTNISYRDDRDRLNGELECVDGYPHGNIRYLPHSRDQKRIITIKGYVRPVRNIRDILNE